MATKTKKNNRGKLSNEQRADNLRLRMTKANQAQAETMAIDPEAYMVAELAYLLGQIARKPKDTLGMTRAQFDAYQQLLAMGQKAIAEKYKAECVEQNEAE